MSLLFCVAGIVLFLVTGLMNGLSWLLPELTGQYLGGVQSSLAILWSRGWGAGISALFVLGAVVFASVRGQLRHRRWLPWLFLGLIILMLLSVNGINAGITFIARDLTNALISKDGDASYRNLWIYGACFAVALPIRSLQFISPRNWGCSGGNGCRSAWWTTTCGIGPITCSIQMMKRPPMLITLISAFPRMFVISQPRPWDSR